VLRQYCVSRLLSEEAGSSRRERARALDSNPRLDPNAHHEQEDLLADVRAAYQREAVERRRLHNLVQELRGNIRVYVRVKPVTPDEAAAGARSVLRCETDSRISCNVQGSNKARAARLALPRCCSVKQHHTARRRLSATPFIGLPAWMAQARDLMRHNTGQPSNPQITQHQH